MTTPTPEAIEAAARALHEHNKHSSMAWDDHKQTYRAYATAALSAAYPLMEAQAKAAGLREAADEFRFCPDWPYRASRPMATEDYLRARAATIERKDS